jgi:3-oxoadipate enol-lactonase
VLLHAGIADRRMWGGLLDPLADEGFRVLAFDLPGFGEAELEPAEVASAMAAPWEPVLASMDALSIERAALVGNSFGAAVALRMAALAPERFSALVSVSAPVPGIEPSDRLAAAWEAEEAALEAEDLEGAVAAVVEAWTLPGAPAEQRELVATMQRRALELQASWPEPDEDEQGDPLADGLGALEGLPLPLLAIAGEHDMSDFRDGAELLARTAGQGPAVVIAGAGHLAPLETSDELLNLLVAFLKTA